MKAASCFTRYPFILPFARREERRLISFPFHESKRSKRFYASWLGCSVYLNFSKKLCRYPYGSVYGLPIENSESASTSQDPPEFAVLLEVDGVLMDAYRLGNRHSFNVAFKKLGLDCSNWSEPVYLDLLRKSGGNEEKMLMLYFSRIGWPTSLPTSEKDSFVQKVLQEKKIALGEFVTLKSSPLRPGLPEFIDDACAEGIPVVILTGYGKTDEKTARAVVDKLGPERVSTVKIVGKEDVEQSLYGRLVLGKSLSSGPEEELAREALKAVSSEKQRIAEEVASILKLSVEIDSSSSESLQMIVAALRAGAESAGVPVNDCILIAGSQTGLAAAQRIAMPCIILRSSLTARAEFPAAKAVMDGFGGADLSISRLKSKK